MGIQRIKIDTCVFLKVIKAWVIFLNTLYLWINTWQVKGFKCLENIHFHIGFQKWQIKSDKTL